MRLKFWNYYGVQKIIFLFSFQSGVSWMRLYARIPNPVSQLKSDNIWPFFAKEQSKLLNSGILTVFDSFLAKKGSTSISILRPDLESLHQGTSNCPQIERKIKTLFFGPRGNFKFSIALRASKTNILGKTNYITLISEKKTHQTRGVHVKKKSWKVTNPTGEGLFLSGAFLHHILLHTILDMLLISRL